MRWEEMRGDQRVRFCGHCAQNVYDVAQLTHDQATALIQRHEGRVCLRLHTRADGTMITRECGFSVRRARERLLASAVALTALAAGFWGAVSALRSAIGGRLFPAGQSRPCPAPEPELQPEVLELDLPILAEPPPPAKPPKPRKPPRVKTITHTLGRPTIEPVPSRKR